MRTLLERFSRALIIGVLGLGVLLALAVGIIALIVIVVFGAGMR
ncbi:MAG TPA: hypothetical protein VE338_06230 [Ktedonobacterales bacterium]|jgi:hypothetical protein|nr:hypothetical protein [Ktedonobacterales bacterium]